jgi:MFS family permease
MGKKGFQEKLITLGIFFISFFTVTTNLSVSIALTDIAEGLVGKSNFLFGLLGSAVFLGNLTTIYVWVKISDRWGKKFTLIVSLSIAAIGVFLLFFATQYWMFLLLQFIIGLNSVIGVVSALIYDTFSEEKRGSPLSIYTIGVVLGFLTGTIIGGPLYSWLDKGTFLFISSFIVLCIISVVITIHESLNSEKKAPKGKIQKPSCRTYIANHKNIIGLLIQNLFNNICFTGGGSYAVYVIFTYLEANRQTGGLFLVPIQVVEIIVFFIIGKKVKNFDKIYRLMFATGFIILGFTVALYYFFAITLVFFGIALASSMQSADALCHIMIPPEHKTNLVSFYRSAGLIGSIVGPALFGLLADEIWIFTPAVFFVIGLFSIVLIYFKWIKKNQKTVIG